MKNDTLILYKTGQQQPKNIQKTINKDSEIITIIKPHPSRIQRIGIHQYLPRKVDYTAPKTAKSFLRTLNNYKETLQEIIFPNGKCLWCTFTQSPEYNLNFDGIVNAFNNYHETIKRKLGVNAYIRKVEMHESGKWHLHAILKFEILPDAKQQKVLAGCWKYAKSHGIHIERVSKTKGDGEGLVHYLTNPKSTDFLPHDRTLTHYRNGQKIISKGGKWDKAPVTYSTNIAKPVGKQVYKRGGKTYYVISKGEK